VSTQHLYPTDLSPTKWLSGKGSRWQWATSAWLRKLHHPVRLATHRLIPPVEPATDMAPGQGGHIVHSCKRKRALEFVAKQRQGAIDACFAASGQAI
jgi:hypothetical protein